MEKGDSGRESESLDHLPRALVRGLGRRSFLGVVGTALLATACGGSIAPTGEGDPEGGDPPGDGATPGGGPGNVAGTTPAVPVDPPDKIGPSTAFPMAVGSGDAQPDAIVLWCQYTGSLALELVVYEMEGATYAREAFRGPAVPSAAGFVHERVSGLKPGMRYRFVFFEKSGSAVSARSEIGRFRTAIAPQAIEAFTFGAVACTNNGRSFETLEHAGFRSDIDLFLLLGDTTYADGSKTLEDFRKRWAENLVTEGYKRLHTSTSLLATWDDHEVDDNFDPEKIDPAVVSAARAAFFEHQPVERIQGAPERIWRKRSWGQTADFFVLDSRSERKPTTAETPQAEYLSLAQMAWLKSELSASQAVFKIILSSVPIGDFPAAFDIGGHRRDRWEGYEAQRAELIDHIESQNISGTLFVGGDFHLASVGKVEKEGKGSSLWEVLAGPGGQNGNPAAVLLTKPQWDWATSKDNYTTFDLDPAKKTIRVTHIDGKGKTLNQQTLQY